MQKTQINLDLEDEFIEVLDKMAGKALKRQAVARMLLIAAIEAVQDNGGKVHLPPKFTVFDDSPFQATRFNEPKSAKSR